MQAWNAHNRGDRSGGSGRLGGMIVVAMLVAVRLSFVIKRVQQSSNSNTGYLSM